jgi:arylamine N-acetyltransferase
MDLGAYFDRIGFDAQPAADRDTLEALMQAHACAVPFENLDVQLRRPLTTSPQEAYRKIVERRRGGWCYEQNGLFGRVLGELGFSVTRMAGAVRDDMADDSRLNNHLVLAVRCPGDDTTWLADVGFGGSHFGPLKLEPQTVVHEPYELQLEQTSSGRWRFTERHRDSCAHYDFAAEPADESALAEKCADLQSNRESTFVQNLVAQRRTPTTHHILRGRLLWEKSRGRATRRRLASAEELVETLWSQFNLDIPEAESLWPRIVARHTELGLD